MDPYKDWDREHPLRRCPKGYESNRANEALMEYAMMGYGRTVPKLLELFKERNSRGVKVPTLSKATCHAWSFRHQWVKRTQRWHDLRREAEIQAFEEMRIESRKERVGILKVYKDKILEAISGTNPAKVNWGDIRVALSAFLEQTRIEFGEGPQGNQEDTAFLKQTIMFDLSNLPTEMLREIAAKELKKGADDES
jgi:hypothetical protein